MSKLCCYLFQIRYIVQTQGQPSHRLLNNATKTSKFFKNFVSNAGLMEWKMKVSGVIIRSVH